MFVEPSFERGRGLPRDVLPGAGEAVRAAVSVRGEGAGVVRVVARRGRQPRRRGARAGPAGQLGPGALLNTCVGVGLQGEGG